MQTAVRRPRGSTICRRETGKAAGGRLCVATGVHAGVFDRFYGSSCKISVPLPCLTGRAVAAPPARTRFLSRADGGRYSG